MAFGNDNSFESPSKKRIYLIFAGITLLCLLPFILFGAMRSPVATQFRYRKPMAVAIKNNDLPAVEKYLSLGVNPNMKGDSGEPLIFLAAKSSDSKLFHLFVDRGAKLTVIDKNGMTPLMHAVQKNDPVLVQKFFASMKNKADLEQRSHAGWTALMYAVEDENDDSALALLNVGADPNATDNGGMTPLMFAVRRQNERLVKILIGQGAQVNTKNNIGLTAFDYAKAQDNQEVLEFLEAHEAKSGTELP